MKTNPTDWSPSATIDSLRDRARLLARLRQFFDERGFFEVQTPCLSTETVIDAHLEPMTVTYGPQSATAYLQTSPEAAMKRIMAAGAKAIYQLGPVFRRDEVGMLHNPEFTMLEWYRRDDDMLAGVQLLCDLVQHTLPKTSLRTVTYQQLFADQFTIDPHEAAIDSLIDLVNQHAPSYLVSAADTRDSLLDVLMGLVIQPQLQGGVIVTNYPISQAALARPSGEDPRTAERFELFVDGIEIANGYAELIDGQQLRRRMESENQRRVHWGRPPLTIPERLIAALEAGLPPCSGTALGVDRLAMLASGANEIAQVIPFPFDRN